MTPEESALATVVAIVTRLRIPYMITGSVAASLHGRPRTTHDADVVIDPNLEQLDHLVLELAAHGFYVDGAAAREAFGRRRQFNAIEIRHACKIDLIIRRDRPFSVEEFRRRTPVDLPFGRGVTVVSAEDSVVSKLEWARLSGDSAKQLADVAAIVAMNPSLDVAYIEHWSSVLGVVDLWHQIAGRA